MSFIFQIFHTVPYSNKPIVKDVIASLHSYFTCNLLIAFSVIISFKQFGGRPMECMLPMGFSGAWEQYAENYCWSQDTYFVPPRKFVEEVSAEERRQLRISYYQWMPFFLLFQAACFKLPTLIWKYFAGHSGMKLGEILRLACDPANSTIDVKTANINALCVHLQGALRFHERVKKKKLVPHKIFRFLNIKYANYYITAVYLIAKIAFLTNNFLQIFLTTRYLLPKIGYGQSIETWKNLIWPEEDNVSSWHNNGVFPRVTLCDFEVREMGNIQTHTVQCVLVVNLFTEKIFILLWAWFVMLAVLTTISLLNWIYLFVEQCSKEHFILNHLEMSETSFDKTDPQNKEQINLFLRKYLSTDGIFVLHMVAAHADVVFATELIASLWRSYNAFEEQRKGLMEIEKIWPQHQQRLESALLEEAKVARKISNDAVIAVQKKRGMLIDTPTLIKRGSSIKVPLISLKDILGNAQCSGKKSKRMHSSHSGGNSPHINTFSTNNQANFKRRRSLDEIDILYGNGIKKFADSSDEDEETTNERSQKEGSQASRKNSAKFW